MATQNTSWNGLPGEIQRYILDFLSHHRGRKHIYATVCREWRTFMEERIFRNLTIGQLRLMPMHLPPRMGLEYLSAQPRAAIQHLWINIELMGPNCRECSAAAGRPVSVLDRATFPNAEYHLYQLFRILSSWGRHTERGLTLEFNAYCPQEQAHWLKNWFIGCPGEPRTIPTLTVDPRHDWRTTVTAAYTIDACFLAIYLRSMKLPPADAVTKFVIRRYCRNRFRPLDIAMLVNACPRLLHLHLETWVHSNASDITSRDPTNDHQEYDLIANIHPRTLRTLTVFQDSCTEYLQLAQRFHGASRVYVDHMR